MAELYNDHKSMYIDGVWRASNHRDLLDVINPATGSAIAELSYGGVDEAMEAVETAARAFGAWKLTTARTRADMLLEASRILLKRAEEIGYVLAVESGKRLAEAVGEVKFAAEYFRWFAEEARRPEGAYIPNEVQNKRHWTRAQPAGVALCLTPWNFPVSIQARKLAPALAAGCTVVARPSQKAPLSVIEVFKCLEEAGFPHGVVNLIHGPAVSTTEAMMGHPAVRVVSFTGSTAVGQSLVKSSARQLQRLALELGGNAPFIVFDDADVEKAVEGAMVAKFRNNGQSCIAANRIYVHDSVYEEFVTRWAATVSRMKLADPVTNPQSDLGPVIDDKARQQLLVLADEAIAGGARPIHPKLQHPDDGFYLSPLLLENVPSDTTFARAELFGPMSPIFRFSDEDEVIKLANDTDMGLAAYVYTNHAGRGARMTEALEYGIVGWNNALPSVAFAPMGGWKQSGLGREGARIGMEEFQEVKYVSQEL